MIKRQERICWRTFQIFGQLLRSEEDKRLLGYFHIIPFFYSYEIPCHNHHGLLVIVNLVFNSEGRISSLLNIGYTTILYQECRHTAFVS